jgi:kinesin family protein C2/C3
MYFFQNERNTRLYFNGEIGNWARMPLAWEFTVPEVHVAIQAINEALPDWKNANEQLLVLRECDYDIADAIAFGEINFAPGSHGQGQGNSNMSAADMQRLADLQAQLASKCREVEALRREKEEESHTAKRELVRERTRVEGLTVRKERVAAEAQVRLPTSGPGGGVWAPSPQATARRGSRQVTRASARASRSIWIG